jgi:hypothetical protein
VITQRRCFDFEMVQLLLRVAGVFASDQIGLPEHAQSSQRDVLQIADGSSDDVEPGSERRRGGKFIVARCVQSEGSLTASAVVLGIRKAVVSCETSDAP